MSGARFYKLGQEMSRTTLFFYASAAGLAVVILLVLMPPSVKSCNEAVCASIVSKCMLTQSCKCDLKNCTCCKECFNCLSYLYSECCSCVDMCPKPNGTASTLSRVSHVEDLPTGIPEVFNVLTDGDDPQERWSTFTFPVDLDTTVFRPKLEKEIKYKTLTAEQEVTPVEHFITLNCTVAYLSQCLSWNKCKASCLTMGASSYRWFHDGCCECVGNTCINYGINESRCLFCPEELEEEEIDEEDHTFDYERIEDKESPVKEEKVEESKDKEKPIDNDTTS